MFELVRAISLAPAADTARGRASIELTPWLADHFPGAPVAPATLLLELAAQIAGPLAEAGTASGAVLGLIRSAVFRAPVALPATIEIGVRVLRREPSSVVCRVEIEAVMTAEIVFAMVEVDEHGEAWREREARVRRWEAAW